MKRIVAAALAAAAFVAGCGDQPAGNKDARKSGPPSTLITTATAEARRLEITEDSVGTLTTLVDPKIGAEVAGRVTRVHAFTGKKVAKGELLAEIDPVDLEIQQKSEAAEVARLEALLANQERIVQNQQRLFEKKFISQNALDDAIAQRSALREQLAAARAKQEAGRNALRKTRVLSPVGGEIELQIVAPGAYVKVGDPLFQLVATQRLEAHLPFPESAAPRLRLGQPVRLSSPLVPGVVVRAQIDEIRPLVTATSRSLDVIAKFDNDGKFRGGATVNGEVVTAVRDNAIMVPEQSVVLRPAGKVVYVVTDGKAIQRQVETGDRKEGRIEIVKGLAAGKTVAADGAGFLTNNAAVTTAPPRSEGGKGGAGKTGKGADVGAGPAFPEAAAAESARPAAKAAKAPARQ